MDFSQKTKGRSIILVPLQERMGTPQADKFNLKLDQCIRSGSTQIILNLKNVKFLDTGCLGVLIANLKKIGARGNICLCTVKPTVQTIFSITRMDKVFKIFDREEEAVEFLDQTNQVYE